MLRSGLVLWLRWLLLVSLELMGAAVTGLVVVASLLAWRLSEGPLRLDAVQPYLVAGLNQAVAPPHVAIGATGLDWGEGHASLGFTARDVRLVNAGGLTVAGLPALDIGLSLPSLLIGRPAPSSIRLSGLRLRLVRSQSGTVSFSLADDEVAQQPAVSSGGSGEAVINTWLETLSHPPEATGMLGALRRIDLSNARVEVLDYQYGVRWQIPQADFRLVRDGTGMRGTVRVEVALGHQSPVLSGAFALARSQGDMRFSLHLDRFNPASLAAWNAAFADLARVDVPFSGQLIGRWMRGAGLAQLHFDLSVGEGKVTAQTDHPPLTVKYAQLVGMIDRQQRRLEIQNLYADFDGPKLAGSALATRSGNDVVVSAATGIDNMPASDLPRYWLPGWAPGARDWVTANISDGLVPKTQAQVRLAVPLQSPETMHPLALSGTMTMQGLTVHYFRPLPPATDAHGTAHFDLNAFHITVDGAKVGPLSLDRARVDLLGLDDNSERADINLTVSGKLADQLLLLDHEPLRYPHRLGLDADKAGGTAVTRAHFQLPLLKDLPIEDVAIAATSKISDAALPNLVMDQGLSGGSLDLRLDGAGMTIAGTGRIGPAKAAFNWRESFLDTVSPSSAITFKGVMDEAARRAFHVAWPEVIGASVGVDGSYVKNRGQPAKLEVALDLTPAALTLPWFDWRKPAGEAAQGKVTVTIANGNVTSVPAFRVSGSGANLRGSVDFAGDSRWQTVHLDALSVPGSELTGMVTNRGDNGFALDFKGQAADVRGVFRDDETTTPPASAVSASDAPPEPLTPLDIRFDIGRVVTGEGRSLGGARGHVIRNSRGWTQLDITGTVGENATPMTVRLVPTVTGRSLTIATDDAGAMLATLGLMKNIQGGRLHVDGKGAGSGPVAATADLRNFRYLQAKTLQRIAAAAQPKGAEELARKEGIPFSRLKAQFDYAEDTLTVNDSRMSGDLMGLTLAGKIDLLGGMLDLSGTIVPLYGINSLVGGIPILGWLLTGGDGGGVFAAAYTVRGPLRDPETSVNPLSILAPGFLRELFFVDRP